MNTYPRPPDHFRTFTTPDAMTPPSHTLLDGIELYPMFGRPVPNIKHPNNCKIQVPSIDSDIVMYDLSGDFATEAKKLAELMPGVIEDLLLTIQTNPDACNEQLRKFDNVIKNIFHLLEVAREHEALDVLIKMAEERIEKKKRILDNLQEATSNARDVFT